MTFCGDWTLMRAAVDTVELKVLPCRSWQCDTCGPVRQRQLIAQAISGTPNLFLTLTVNPAYLDTPLQRRYALAAAFNHLIRLARRRWPKSKIEYMAVVEKTKRGEPHLHVLLRAGFIPQRWVSAQMARLIHAPICDVQAVKSHAGVAAYVAKYVSKEPAQFGTAKRYWFSRCYRVSVPPPQPNEDVQRLRYQVTKHHITLIVRCWRDIGYRVIHNDGHLIRMYRDGRYHAKRLRC